MEPFLIPLFAQQMAEHVEPAATSISTVALVLPIVALMIPIVVVPTALGVRLAKQKREMEHRERMKALDIGRSLPGDEPEWSPARIALKIGAGVPLGVMAIAWLANLTLGRAGEGAWQAASFIGLAAVIGGTVLAIKAINLAYQPHQDQHGYDNAAHKPAFDPEAYDHVGTRG
jgi:hypothetical protein